MRRKIGSGSKVRKVVQNERMGKLRLRPWISILSLQETKRKVKLISSKSILNVSGGSFFKKKGSVKCMREILD